MVEAIDLTRPVYSAVNINIRKPEINKAKDTDSTKDNGIYNSVKVDIDNPSINTEPKKVYDYPENEEVVTYDQVYAQQNALPVKYQVAQQYEASEIIVPEEVTDGEEAVDIAETTVPEPNYTTLEAEKAEKKTLNNENNDGNISFKAETELKKPEIIPSEDIKPEVDINKAVSNLASEDFDTQALQMNEIVQLADKPEKAKEYLVSDVISSLINIAEKDTSALAKPTQKQLEIRDKIMADYIAIQEQGGKPDMKLPYPISDEEAALAMSLSPFEQAERNKEYALVTMAMLDKIYIDDVKKENGNVVALTDVPGISSMVDALRFSKNDTVKLAAIDSLRYIARPEYNNELNTIFRLAQADSSPIVSEAARYSLNKINETKQN